MNPLKLTLARFSDLALSAAAIAVCAVAVRQFVASPTSAAQNPVRVTVNAGINLKEVNFHSADKTLLLVASSNCRYCSNSMEFYKRISGLESRLRGQLRFVVVGGEPRETLVEYFGQHSVEVDDVISLERTRSPSAATPTLILVDRDGTVTAVWRGQQPPSGELEIIRAVS